MPTMSSPVQSIDRVIDIIEALSNAPNGITLSDLATMTELHISTTHRLVVSLVNRGYVRKDPSNGKYRLTLRMYEIGSRVSGVLDLTTLSRPYLDDLAISTQEVVHLVKHDGNNVIYLYKSEPFQPFVWMSSFIGHRNPMYCTGVGKSILAFLPEAEIKSIWQQTDIQTYTAHTITDFSVMQQELQLIRKRGYALDNEEHEEGVRCVACPIFDYSNQPVASISVSAPVFRMPDATIEKIAVKLKAATAEISQLLGCTR